MAIPSVPRRFLKDCWSWHPWPGDPYGMVCELDADLRPITCFFVAAFGNPSAPWSSSWADYPIRPGDVLTNQFTLVGWSDQPIRPKLVGQANRRHPWSIHQQHPTDTQERGTTHHVYGPTGPAATRLLCLHRTSAAPGCRARDCL